jgi:hypothetical protein
VFADHLHHVHLGDQVDHVVVGVAFLQHLHCNNVPLSASADQAGHFSFDNLDKIFKFLLLLYFTNA